LLGCSPSQLKAHFEAQFDVGMSWANRGHWQIDHIKQVAEFDLTDATQRAACFHYTNLRPLWSIENMRRQRRA
jgi:hypothetical protein